MIRWIPRLTIHGVSIADHDWQAEGRLAHLRWGWLVIEITIARAGPCSDRDIRNAR